jgi:RNA polymerase sigma-70 factor (ECF subfamily)
LAHDLAIRDIQAAADEAIVGAIAGGSADALGQLYDRHGAVCYGLARRIVGQPDVAEEIVQDVFAQVWREAARYARDRATVAGWLVMLTRARAIDRVRSRRARPDAAAGVALSAVPPPTAADPDPEAAALTAAEAHSVRQALIALPDQQRALLDLAYYEGLTHSEIAERTGIPLGTVKTRLRAAMLTLRDAIGRQR